MVCRVEGVVSLQEGAGIGTGRGAVSLSPFYPLSLIPSLCPPPPPPPPPLLPVPSSPLTLVVCRVEGVAGLQEGVGLGTGGRTVSLPPSPLPTLPLAHPPPLPSSLSPSYLGGVWSGRGLPLSHFTPPPPFSQFPLPLLPWWCVKWKGSTFISLHPLPPPFSQFPLPLLPWWCVEWKGWSAGSRACRKVRDSALVEGLSMLSRASAAARRPLCCCCSHASTETGQVGGRSRGDLWAGFGGLYGLRLDCLLVWGTLWSEARLFVGLGDSMV